jgi:hypothetical protein
LTEVTQHIGTQNVGTQNIATHDSATADGKSDGGLNWTKLRPILTALAAIAVGALAVIGALAIFGVGPLSLFGSHAEVEALSKADTPPVEFAYFDAPRTESYLDQADDGLAKTVEHKEQVTRSANASLSAGANAQLGGSEQSQDDTVTTVTPDAADRFYTLLRQLRDNDKEIEYSQKSAKCKGIKDGGPPWFGDVNESDPAQDVVQEVRCIGAGNFIRIRHTRLLLPAFARMLPRLHDTDVLSRTLPAPRTPFDSPMQSIQLSKAMSADRALIGSNPRIPFVGEPYAHPRGKERSVAFFLPSLYRGLAREPSLLDGSMTIVGLVVAAGTRTSYVDYPTISAFGHALLTARKALRADLGMCVTISARTRPQAHCTSASQTVAEIRRSVTLQPPFVVVLPLAIYDDGRA